MDAALARASRGNQVEHCPALADAQMCLLVQAETRQAVQNLQAIADTEAVDGAFFGPADLSASMGYPGQADHPEVIKTLLEGLATVRAAGKAPGILMTDPQQAQRCLDAGALFVAVGAVPPAPRHAPASAATVRKKRSVSVGQRTERSGTGRAPSGAGRQFRPV